MPPPLTGRASSQDAPWREIPPQQGRRFVVTGANSGIGLAMSTALATAGAHVTMAVRNRSRGERAAQQVTPRGGSVQVGVVDVSDLASVRAFADTVEHVDVLINNAGILAVPFELTDDGVDLQFATNHLGHFALANLLLPRITDRVVVVGSRAHRRGTLDLDDLDWRRRGYRPYAAYGQSKLANLLFMAELQRRLTAAGSTLRATAGHPGSTATHITAGTGSAWKTRVGEFGHRLVGMESWKGALPVLYAATMDVPGNSYFGPGGPGEMQGWPVPVGRSGPAGDPDLAKALWERSEQLTGVSFPLSRR